MASIPSTSLLHNADYTFSTWGSKMTGLPSAMLFNTRIYTSFLKYSSIVQSFDFPDSLSPRGVSLGPCLVSMPCKLKYSLSS